MTSEGKIKKISPSSSQPACYFIEIDIPRKDPAGEGSASASLALTEQKVPYSLELTLCSELTNALSREVIQALLQRMDFKRILKGEQFIQQGEEADQFYLILKGSCIVRLEKDNMLYTIAQLGPGDLVGEMAVFTGEKRSAGVEAETDMDVLSMSRDQFEKISEEYPEFRSYLSEIVTHRLSTSKIMAEKKIGKYILTEKIGDGGSSIIYRGIHSVLNLPVAIKMLKHELAMDPDFIQIFSNEAKIVAQLNHPQIVRVYDIEELFRTVFIIMEYLEGVPLRQMLDNIKKMPLAKTLDIVLQACYGLEYAHKYGIIHQDINPKNIFLQPDGSVKIIDFGLACRTGSVDTNFLFPGTIYYISPEQIKGDPVDERSDIYSLGITVYEMLTGTLPYSGDDMKTLVNWHLNEEIHDTRSSLPDLPDEMHTFFMRSIRKDPRARFNNVSEVIGLLKPLAEKLGIKVEPNFCIQQKMIGMFLVYQEQQRLTLKRLIEEFNRNVSEAGAVLKITQFEDL
ncbi:MAG TPA: protein kinase [Thermodesulfovibrionales bacterium]|nr:protein kinase [Thermodesulfovibrionales bacterium]